MDNVVCGSNVKNPHINEWCGFLIAIEAIKNPSLLLASKAILIALIPYEKRKENFANTERKWERKDIEIFWLIEFIDLYMKQGLYTPFPISGPKPS